MSEIKGLPTEIVTTIFTYLENTFFFPLVATNQEIEKRLQEELYIRKKKKILDILVRDTICFSNLNLGKDGNFRCPSQKERKLGSVFCPFCNHVLKH